MSGFYQYDTRAPFVIPCECGSREAYWHNGVAGLRVYGCDKCWRASREGKDAIAAGLDFDGE